MHVQAGTATWVPEPCYMNEPVQVHPVVSILILLRCMSSSLNCAGWYSYLGTWAMLQLWACLFCRLNFCCTAYDLSEQCTGTATWVPEPCSIYEPVHPVVLILFCYVAYDPLWTVQDGTAIWVPGPCSMNQSTSLFLSSSLSWQSFSFTRWVLLTLWNNLHKNVQKKSCN